MAQFKPLFEEVAEKGLSPDAIVDRLTKQCIETPSWGYADSGTRFGKFRQPWAASSIYEKIEDAGTVQRYTGVTPLVAMHVLWDFVGDDLSGVGACLEENGVRIGGINPNLFQDQCYKLGSFGNPDAGVRDQAVQHCLDSIEIAGKVGSKVLSLWFADGTYYPGQDDIRRRMDRFTECLQRVYKAMPEDMRMMVEYKPFEPTFYHTDIADWGMAATFARRCGPRAKVLCDLGHHLQGANVEHIVAFLLAEGMLGGFHFNDSKYADDDLTTGSLNPYELFLIFGELVAAEDDPSITGEVIYTVDQSHNEKSKIEAMLQTVEQIQRMWAKALCVDRKALRAAQDAGDIVGGEQCLVDAFNLDVRPLLYAAREKMGVPSEPLKAFRTSGHLEKLAAARAGNTASGGLG